MTGVFAATVLAAIVFFFIFWIVVGVAIAAFGVLYVSVLALFLGWTEVDNTEEDE